jgi:hypothetical protein
MGPVLGIVLFPHSDIHIAMSGTLPLHIKIMERRFRQDSTFPNGEDQTKYELTDVTSSCTFRYLAPFENVGQRIQAYVNIDNSGLVTPTTLGTNLVFITHTDSDGNHHTMVARIQVHQTIRGWWFGNSSITSAKDTYCAHSQPSIYALFSDDTTGTDLVGDITGHSYVDLTSLDPAVFTMDTEGRGRIWGHNDGSGTLRGSFLGTTHNLPVKIVDYGLRRDILEPIQFVKTVDDAHNILFIPEGFRDTNEDREKFDNLVTKITDDLFHKPRHQPYGLLQGSFNVFKAFVPSEQYTLSCGFKVNDESVPDKFDAGFPIPYKDQLSSTISNPYSPEELIKIVGLPKRNETRTPAQLRFLWQTQALLNYNDSRVDDNLVNIYKKEVSVGILEARDTFFGLLLGERYADRSSGVESIVPAIDVAGDPNMPFYIDKMYDWYRKYVTRSIDLDPRRHPPELVMGGYENPNSSIMQFIKNLHYKYDPHDQIGTQWVPDPYSTVLQKSRGLVAVITHEGMIAGTSFNNGTLVGLSLNNFNSVGFQYVTTSSTEKVMRRNPPSEIPMDVDDVISTLAHEFGHSFRLGDEYEEYIQDIGQEMDWADNIASLYTIRVDDNYRTNRLIDMDKVKWFDLLRIKLSSATIEPSTEDAGRLKVKIDSKFCGKWKEAKDQHVKAFIRNRKITRWGNQLPLVFNDQNYIPRLDIIEVDEVNGYIYLGGLDLPPHPLPVFDKGSLLFIPQTTSSDEFIYVVEKKVLDYLKNNPTNKNLPLNKDTDTTKINNGSDLPKSIPDFKPPCRSYKLIGIYEGANMYTGMQYRPAGACKMRDNKNTGGEGEFCFVCKYLIVNRVDPGMHDVLDHRYYPTAKKN